MKALFERILKKRKTIQPKKARLSDKKVWDLEETLVTLRALDEDIPITVGQACEGIMVFGTSGSGKTSGALNTIQLGMMEAGFGMLNICVKADEADRVIALAKKAGREKDLRIMRLGSDATRFGFLDFLRAGGATAVTAGFKRINQSLLGKVDEDEWTQASQEHLTNLVQLFIMAGEKLDISALRMALDDKPLHKKMIVDALDRCANGSSEEHTIKMLGNYFLKQWVAMGDKTMASVLMSITPTLNPFCTGYMRDLFCTETNFTPKDLRQGTILVLDIPCVGENFSYGIAAGTILKYMTQKMIESYFGEGQVAGQKKAGKATRPVAIVVDECHYVTTADDSEFVTTSRSMRGGLFYLTQDINNFYKRGAKTIEAETGALLSNLHGVRIMHQNADDKTFQWFSNVLGKEMKEQFSESGSFSGPTGSGSVSTSRSWQEKDQVARRDFNIGLARGGPKWKYVVTGILQQDGRVYKGGKMWKQVAFQQMDLDKYA